MRTQIKNSLFFIICLSLVLSCKTVQKRHEAESSENLPSLEAHRFVVADENNSLELTRLSVFFDSMVEKNNLAKNTGKDYSGPTNLPDLHEQIRTTKNENGAVTAFHIPKEISPHKVDQTYQVQHVPSIEELRFENGEDLVYVALARKHPLVKDIPKGGHIIRDRIEYRILIQDDKHAVLEALNLNPSFRSTEDIAKDIQTNMQTFPKKNFRNDPLFDDKISVMKRFQESRYTLHKEGDTGELSDGTHFEAIKQIGEGSYGWVLLVRFTKSDKTTFDLAIKIQRPGKRTDLIENEISYLDGMTRHPNSVQYFGTVVKPEGPKSKNSYYIAMEPLKGDWEHARGQPNEAKTRMMIGAADVYSVLHSAERVHMDTRGDNLLYTEDGSTRLADFGLSGSMGGGNRNDLYVPKVDINDLGESMIKLRMKETDYKEGTKEADFVESAVDDIEHVVIEANLITDSKQITLNQYFEKYGHLFSSWNQEEMKLLFSLVNKKNPNPPTAAFIAKRLREIHKISNI